MNRWPREVWWLPCMHITAFLKRIKYGILPSKDPTQWAHDLGMFQGGGLPGQSFNAFSFCFASEKMRRRQTWHGRTVHLSCQQCLQCQVNYISTWSRPEERDDCASRECHKDLIIIFGKAMRSGSVMSLLRITLLVAFLDAWAFQSDGTSLLLCPSFLLGLFPGPSPPPCPGFAICILSKYHFPSPFCCYSSFHLLVLEVEGMSSSWGCSGDSSLSTKAASGQITWLASTLLLLPLCSWDSEVMGKVTMNLWPKQKKIFFPIVPYYYALQHSLLISASVSPSVKVM